MKKIFISFLLLFTVAVISLINLGGNNQVKAGVGDTIAQTFPDPYMAQAVANIVSGGNINAIITQSMIDTRTILDLTSFYESDISSLEGITIFKNLTYIRCSFSQITTLPDDFGSLSKLKTLDLYHNYNLTSLPDSFGDLSSLEYLDLSHDKLTRLPDNFGNLSKLVEVYLLGNQLTSLPNSFVNLNINELWILTGYDLLPRDFENSLPSNIEVIKLDYYEQLELQSGIAPIDITSQADLDNLDLASMVALESQKTLSPVHVYILDAFVDENNDPVALSDYISPSGVVIQAGKVFASVRATGTGLFPNNSDPAITVDKIELNFILTLYEASFDLNGGEGTAPESQQAAEGSLLTAVADPLRSGYTFIGWNTSIDGSGTTWDFATNTMPAGDITLYAIWAENTTGTEDNDTTATEDTADSLPQTGMYIYLIAGVTTLVAGIGLITFNHRKIKS